MTESAPQVSPNAGSRTADLCARSVGRWLCCVHASRQLCTRKGVELSSDRNGWHPAVAQQCGVLDCGHREVWISEVPDGDADFSIAAAEDQVPVDRGTTSRAEVMVDYRPTGSADTVNLQAVVARRLARDRDDLLHGEERMDREDAPGPLLAEGAVTGHDARWFVLDDDFNSATGTLSGSRRHLMKPSTQGGWPQNACGRSRQTARSGAGTRAPSGRYGVLCVASGDGVKPPGSGYALEFVFAFVV
jgi:hypothetical protein